MAKLDKKKIDLDGLWESGVPLDYAWIDFAPFFDRFAYQALLVHPDNDVDVLDVNHPRYQEINRGWLPKTWKGRQKKLEIVSRNERARLLDRIYHGYLLAVGYRTLEDGSDELTRVPRQHFFVDYESEDPPSGINWNKGEIRVGAESYFDIRIVEVPDEDADKQASIAVREHRGTSARTSRAGRPGTGKQIRSAVEQALNSNASFRDLPNRQVQAEEIRAQLCGEDARYAHDKVGYSTNTIKKIIGQVVNKVRSD